MFCCPCTINGPAVITQQTRALGITVLYSSNRPASRKYQGEPAVSTWFTSAEIQPACCQAKGCSVSLPSGPPLIPLSPSLKAGMLKVHCLPSDVPVIERPYSPDTRRREACYGLPITSTPDHRMRKICVGLCRTQLQQCS